ncbi:hypothetical protein Gpo141_00009519 [Globisporangium polare]
MTRNNVASLIARIPGRQPRDSSHRNSNDNNSDPSGNSNCKTPHKFRSQSSTCSDDPSNVSSCTSSPGVGSAKVYVDDQELHARARAVSAEIDFDALTNLSLSKWAWKESRKEFTLFEAANTSSGDEAAEAQQQPEVLASGDINCSIEEIVALLRSLNEVDLNATMKALHQKDFIYGSLVHVVPSLQQESDEQPEEGVALSHEADNYVAVKTSTFVRSKVFARNEEWCFLESFERSPTGDSLVISQSSIPASALKVGKAQRSRVDQLGDITTAFLVERIPRTRSVRLVFHGKFDGLSEAARARCSKGGATSKMASARLKKLARGVSRIPELVRRRRLGVQKFADRTAFAAKNSRCICCTKSLSLFLLKKRQRCHLCAYNVCDKCCSQETMETFNGHTTSVLMCRRCMECVDSCEYAGICTQTRRAIRVELDVAESPAKRQRRNALVNIFEAALEDPDEAYQTAAETVIQHIASPEGATHEPRCLTAERLNSITDHLDAVKKTLEHEDERLPPLDECVLANAKSRTYHIHVPEDPATTVPDYPMPENEAQRLRAIHENDFVNLGEVMELNIICSLAAEALQCRISMITVIDRESEFILSCNMEFLHRTWMARNQTFCSHLLMDDKPLLIRNPEADVRFFNFDAVTKCDIRFYCGFPISAADGTIVGSVCCLDVEQRSLTQSQYSMMTTLARTASKVIQTRASARKAQSSVGKHGQ